VVVNRGRLIAFEGIDGCGKSTQVEALAARLTADEMDCTLTREPTNGKMGTRIREMLRSGEVVPPSEELRWFMEDRAEHVETVIEPALAAGHWVLTDRYYLSTVAYQSAHGLDAKQILQDSERAFPIPDLALLFEIDAAAGLGRVSARGEPTDPAFERIDYQRAVAAEFAALDLPYIERIDADRPEPVVAADVLQLMADRFGIEFEP
jgi:dTMP kinase